MSEPKLTEVHGSGPVHRLQTRNAVRAPLETVWNSLTRIEHVREWWADGAMGKSVGEPVQLGKAEDLRGTIITMLKPHVFEFTWHDEPSKSARPEWIDSQTNGLVRFDLVQIAENTTLLTLSQFVPSAGLPGAPAGWHQLFECFSSYVETGEVSSTDDRFEVLKALYEQ